MLRPRTLASLAILSLIFVACARPLLAVPTIVEVDADEVRFRPDDPASVAPGDEYAIIEPRAAPDGDLLVVQRGLLVVRSVEDAVVRAQVIYATPHARSGDEVQSIPRRGVDLTGYFDVLTDGIEIANTAGFRVTVVRGFAEWRPFAAVEVPVRDSVGLSFFRLNALVGGEWNARMGRLRVAPSLAVGAAGSLALVPDAGLAPVYLSHAGILAGLTGSLRVARDLAVQVRAGLGYWHGVYAQANPGYAGLASHGGLIVGAGVTLK